MLFSMTLRIFFLILKFKYLIDSEFILGKDDVKEASTIFPQAVKIII